MLIVYSIFVILILALFFACFFTVEQQHVAIVERFGKFSRLANPGLSLKIPFVERVAAKESLRVEQLAIQVDTTTKDNVFTSIHVAVQYAVEPNRVQEAYYQLANSSQQMGAYVSDAVRSKVPHMDLNDALQKKDEIAGAAKAELNEAMSPFGFKIVQALVTDIVPDAKVMEAMNAIVAARRHREAAEQQGEADKILKIKAAEAEAESKRLQGEGIAAERAAIVNGLRDSVEAFSKAVPGVDAQQVMALVTTTQYFDTLNSVGTNSKNTVIMLPHSASAGSELMEQIMAANAGNTVK